MPSRSLEGAKEAYKKKDIEASIAAHKGTKISRAPEVHKQHGQYLKSAVYGGLDGIITTFAVVAGVAGASLSAGIVLILGFANLIADGISMAIGDYLSTKSEQEYHKSERKREQWEIENYPEGEKKEMIEIYMEKGFTQTEATRMVNIMSKNKRAWLDLMMVHELGILESDENPIYNAIVTFFSFAIFGFIPLLAYVVSLFIPIHFSTFLIACVLTAITLFSLGAIKVKITDRNWFRSGFETLLIGGIAAAAAYLVGYLLAGLA